MHESKNPSCPCHRVPVFPNYLVSVGTLFGGGSGAAHPTLPTHTRAKHTLKPGLSRSLLILTTSPSSILFLCLPVLPCSVLFLAVNPLSIIFHSSCCTVYTSLQSSFTALLLSLNVQPLSFYRYSLPINSNPHIPSRTPIRHGCPT